MKSDELREVMDREVDDMRLQGAQKVKVDYENQTIDYTTPDGDKRHRYEYEDGVWTFIPEHRINDE